MSTFSSSFTVRYQAADGESIVSVVIYYAVSDSNTTAPTSWSTTCPTMTADYPYLWRYEVTTYTDGNTVTSDPYVVGNYNGIKSLTQYYLLSAKDSGVTISTSGWTTTADTPTEDYPYLWYYEEIAFTDGSTWQSTPIICSMYGAQGEDGPTYSVSPASVSVTSDSLTYSGSISVTLVVTDSEGNTVTPSAISFYSRTNCTAGSASASTGVVSFTPSSRTVSYTDAGGTAQSMTVSYTAGRVVFKITIDDDFILYHTLTWTIDISAYSGGLYWDSQYLLSEYSEVKSDVSTLTSNYSSISQTAEEIQSTVGQLTANLSNDDGVNLFTNSILNAVTKRYCASSSYSPVSCTLTSGTTYTLTVKARLSDTFTTTNAALRVYPSDYSGASLYFTSTDYETQSVTFTATADGDVCLYWYMGTYSSSGSWSKLTSSAISYVQIYRVQLEDGDSFSGWSYAMGEDSVKSNMLSDTLSDLISSGTVTESAEVSASGDTVTLDYATISSAETFVSTSIAAGDMLPSCTYTLSFYAMCTSEDTITAALYRSSSSTNYNVDGGIASDGSLIEYTSEAGTSGTGDGSTDIALSTSWKRYCVMWTMFEGSNVSSYAHLLTLTSANGDTLIGGIKLEQNGIVTSYFGSTYTTNLIYSQITQTADEIKLAIYNELEETGIDITNRTITATANCFIVQDNSENTLMSVVSSTKMYTTFGSGTGTTGAAVVFNAGSFVVNNSAGNAAIATDSSGNLILTSYSGSTSSASVASQIYLGGSVIKLVGSSGATIVLDVSGDSPEATGTNSDGETVWYLGAYSQISATASCDLSASLYTVSASFSEDDYTVSVKTYWKITNNGSSSVTVSSSSLTCKVVASWAMLETNTLTASSTSLTIAAGATSSSTYYFYDTAIDCMYALTSAASADVKLYYGDELIGSSTIIVSV